MTYRPDGGIRTSGLTERDRARLSALEATQTPTEWQRGELSALRIRAASADDQRRTAALTRKWG